MLIVSKCFEPNFQFSHEPYRFDSFEQTQHKFLLRIKAILLLTVQ